MTELAIAKTTGLISAGLAGSGALFAITDAVSISITTSVAAVVMAAVSAYFAYRSKVIGDQVHTVINSRMTELLELSKKSSTAEGKMLGREEEKARQSAVTLSEAKGAADQKAADLGKGSLPH